MSHQHSAENIDPHQPSSSVESPLFDSKPVGNRLYWQVADSLAQFIMSNRLSIGDRLPSERELAQVYEVSRQTIREALIVLEVRHLVSIKPGSGVYVETNANSVPTLTLSQQPEYLEIVEALARFAGEATFLATQRASNKELLMLNAYIKQTHQLVAQQRFSDIAEHVNKMHHLIATASRNTIVEHTTKWLWHLHDTTSSRLFQQQKQAVQDENSNPEQLSQRSHLFFDNAYCEMFITCYQSLYKLMSQRDADKARNRIQAHLRYLSEYFSIT